MRTIACLYGPQPRHLETIRSAAPGFDIVTGDESELRARLEDAEIVVGWNGWTEEICLRPQSKLRWVQAWGAGVEHMPLDAFERRNIMLTNASGVHAYPISETVFGMMLSFARKLHAAARNQADKRWAWLGELEEIHGKTLGLVGVGAIGEEIARLARAFRMQVLGVRRSGAPSPHVDRMYDHHGLNEVLAESDFVVVTLPLTKDTRRLIDASRFKHMKPGAYFINIGRGLTVDTEALIEALRSGAIAGAGLDVFEQEPLPESSPLWAMENVIITPHNSGSSVYYDDRAAEIFVANLRDYVQGKEPGRNRVDLRNQY
ncbi:2-hydroxyacid dehydrogenase [Paenibacillus sp. 32O-W]|jgi:phosphoglycerate dehydrogenase-like enzyme|uniref:D-2-hydroxyacid dehydrogenase n=1 Tax=Paenibacillus sp. 32O-W TaxID=1695218 RepID=UPI00071F52D1|nr:D-2-hydroxyacid dehydrogenase [Paenibacillus sp. 32O-W]ALS25547.1 2-hydroxyacid dehydrogenase [Paenibacillus sp. 32O-W]